MSQRTLGLIMNGVSGRMGVNQHLIRSVAAIRAQGGVLMSDGSRVMLDPVLVSRTGEKVKALAEQHGGLRWTSDLDAEIASPRNHIFFDTATTQMQDGRKEDAIAMLNSVIARRPDTADAYISLAHAYWEGGRPQMATANCSRFFSPPLRRP